MDLSVSNASDSNSGQAGKVIDEGDLIDITWIITSCASRLTMEEPFLCREDSFQLHDAMAATQLMDAKMDSCEVPAHLAAPLLAEEFCNDEEHDVGLEKKRKTVLFPRPCPESLLSDMFVPLPWNELTIEEASLVVVNQLVRLQALFMGASVGESIFTVLYAHKPILAEMEEVLLAEHTSSFCENNANNNTLAVKLRGVQEKALNDTFFCAQFALFASTCALVEITELFRSIVINADIYEEEDFVTNTHDIPFFSRDKPTLCLYLDTAVNILRHHHDNQNAHMQKLKFAILYLNSMLVFCSTMGKLQRHDLVETVQAMRALIVSSSQDLTCLQELVAANTSVTAHGGAALPSHSEKRLLAQTFDSYVNRPLFGNTPVRKVSFLDPHESIAKLIAITQELDWAVCGLLTHGTNLARIDRMLRRFCSLNILTRSLIVLNLYFDDLLLGKHALQPLIVAHMRQWEYVPESLIQNNEHAQAFLGRLAKPIYDVLKLQISNRNRQRAYIEAAMFHEWTSIQNEANLVDTHYRKEQGLDNTTPPAFGFYVLSYLLRLMDQHLTCGIEGGLFHGHDEICSAFWYRDFLLAALIQNLTRMRKGKELYSELQAKQLPTQQEAGKGKGGKKKNIHQNKNHSKANGKIVSPPQHQRDLEEIEDALEVQVLEAKRMLCRGIVRYIVAVRQAGFLTAEEEFEFTSPRTRFERRFAVFAESIQHPPALTYDDYLEGSDGSNISVQGIYQSALEIFKACRVLVEAILNDIGSINAPHAPVQETEARSLLKVCVGNSVYIMKLSQFVVDAGSSNYSNGKKKVSFEFDFGAHKEFCILKLVM